MAKLMLIMAHAHAGNEVMSTETEELLQSQLQLYHHSLALVKSLALSAATDLRIPEAVHRRGGAATLSDITAETGIHRTKLPHLRRLMRVLAISGVFSVRDDDVYQLTGVSRLLLAGGGGDCDLSPVVRALVDPLAVAALFSAGEWFTDERASLFEAAHGCTRWEMAAKNAADSSSLNAAVAADSGFVMDVLVRNGSGCFEGLSSLVDVGGGHGAAAAAVAKAFPHVRCTVLDLPHVVAGAPPAAGNVQFVAGDFFDYIPPANAVLLKLILHCWKDEDAVRILRRCKEAIPARDAGGKVIIIDVVLAASAGPSHETQLMFDVFNMHLDGAERDEQGWSKIFFDAGFSDYKIKTVLGFRSVIEVYP